MSDATPSAGPSAELQVPDDLPGALDTAVRQRVGTVEIAASPTKVWTLITALDRMGEWSNENTGGYWRKGEDGEPGTGEVGDVFVGVNRLDGEEWKAPVEIVARDDEREFAFVTGGLSYNIALWRYQLADGADGGTTVTESWTLRQLSPRMVENGEAELDYRTGNAERGIAATLAALKAAAEA